MDEIIIKFTPLERDLLLEHTFVDPDLTNRLKIAQVKGDHIVVKYSAQDLEELIGYIAAEENHTDDVKIKKSLDKLYDKLSDILDDF